MKCRIIKTYSQQGFTLIEIAIVMVIIGFLTGAGISIMGILTKKKARNEAIDSLRQAKSTLISYANINGRLPWADSDADGNENAGATSGTFPYLTLRVGPTDSFKRVFKYEINANLGTDRPTGCNAIGGGLSGAPTVVDYDGSTTAFSVAAILISAGPMDADSDGNVFDDIAAGTHQGDNTGGIPNYLRYPATDDFDDLVVYIGDVELFGEMCGNPVLAVRNTSGATVYVYDQTQGSDIGILNNGDLNSYRIISGKRIEIRDTAGGGGNIVLSTPVTPLIVAGAGSTITIP